VINWVRPLHDVRLHEDGRTLRFEALGFRKPTQGYYILCSKNCQLFFTEKGEFGLDVALKHAIERQQNEKNNHGSS